jgi:hypothetical protein
MKRFLKKLVSWLVRLFPIAFFLLFGFSIVYCKFLPLDIWGVIIRLGLLWMVLAINFIIWKQSELKTQIRFIKSDVIYRLLTLKNSIEKR